MRISSLAVIKEEESIEEADFYSAFEMIFGTKNSKDLLPCLLNSLLNLKDEIIDARINNTKSAYLLVFDESNHSNKGEDVNILCRNKGMQKIAVKIQTSHTSNLFDTKPGYCAKLLTSEVDLETYMVIIGQESLQVAHTSNESIISQKSEIFLNKTDWSSFELTKFEDIYICQPITQTGITKYNWLRFLISLSKQDQKKDINFLIKVAKGIKAVATWDKNSKILYWKYQQNIIDTYCLTDPKKIKKVLIKNEIEAIKMLIKVNIPSECYISTVEFLNKKEIDYIQEHLDQTNSQIYIDLDLAGKAIEEEETYT
jgi:hypothetical protein